MENDFSGRLIIVQLLMTFRPGLQKEESFFLMPDGCFFSYFSAFQHLVMLLRVFRSRGAGSLTIIFLQAGR